MKNNLFHPATFFRFTFFLFLLLPLYAVSQTVTGTISTQIFHNSSSTSNSVLTYSISLSNGWKPGISYITGLTLQDASSSVVYTHPTADAYDHYGTVSISLAPGYYKFTGTISTTNTSGVVSVSVVQEVWVGYKPEWEKSLDLSEGYDQYALKRSNVSAGITRAYAQSFNSLAANTAGWFEMNAPATTTANSSVFFVLEPQSNVSTFSPGDNISYVEYFYTNSTTKGIRVKARNSLNAYTMYTLSANLGDKLRFERDASGNAKLYINGSTVAHTFAKTLTAQLQLTVYATLGTDMATQLVSSFGYPSTNLPLSNTFASDKGTGDATIRISPLTGFLSPYHYFVSQQPVPELKAVYHFLQDSVYDDPVDSTDFFTGPDATTDFTMSNTPMGNYYMSAFDSRGVRIYSNTYSVLPSLGSSDYSERTSVQNHYDEFLSCAPDSYACPNIYMTDLTKGSVVFHLQELNAEHCFGVLVPGTGINSGADPYSIIEYGFYVKDGLLFTVEKGVLSSTSYTAKKDVAAEIVQAGATIELRYEGVVLETYAPEGTYYFTVGMNFVYWGTKLRVRPYNLTLRSYRVPYTLSDNACSDGDITLTITYPEVSETTFHGTTITASNFQLRDAYTSAAIGSANESPLSVPPGVYLISGSVTAGGVTILCNQYIYVGYTTVWDSPINMHGQSDAGLPPAPHALGDATVDPDSGEWGQAIATGKLPATEAGWIAFAPAAATGSSFEVNTLVLTESPQYGSLDNPPYTMPVLFFNTTGGIMLLNNPSTQSVQVLPYAPGIPIVAQRDGSNVYKLLQHTTQLGSSLSGYYAGRWKPSVLVRTPESGVHSVVSNFTCPASSGQYAHLKYELDGYRHNMSSCNINFLYFEEYAASELQFTLYTSNLFQLYDQNDFPVVNTTPGENRITLYVGDDQHCIGIGTFILDVVNAKKEHFYLRFYNGGCTSCEASGGGEEQEEDN